MGPYGDLHFSAGFVNGGELTVEVILLPTSQLLKALPKGQGTKYNGEFTSGRS